MESSTIVTTNMPIKAIRATGLMYLASFTSLLMSAFQRSNVVLVAISASARAFASSAEIPGSCQQVLDYAKCSAIGKQVSYGIEYVGRSLGEPLAQSRVFDFFSAIVIGVCD